MKRMELERAEKRVKSIWIPLPRRKVLRIITRVFTQESPGGSFTENQVTFLKVEPQLLPDIVLKPPAMKENPDNFKNITGTGKLINAADWEIISLPWLHGVSELDDVWFEAAVRFYPDNFDRRSFSCRSSLRLKWRRILTTAFYFTEI